MIDVGFNKNVATSQPGSITMEMPGRANTTNGAVNTYEFSITTSVPWVNGDVLKFSFPKEVVVNADGKTTVCTPKNPDDEIICGISGNDIQIELKNMAPRAPADPANPRNYEMTLEWSMTNIGNPGSVKPSEGFKDMRILTDDNYIVSQMTEPTANKIITNTEPATIQKPELFQDSLINSTSNNYTITFTPINALPAAGSIKLEYPKYITLDDGDNTKCFVTTNKLFSSNCEIDTQARTIIIKEVFATAAPYSSTITIMLQNVKNPSDNRRYDDDGFNLSTYFDADQQYIQDSAK